MRQQKSTLNVKSWTTLDVLRLRKSLYIVSHFIYARKALNKESRP